VYENLDNALIEEPRNPYEDHYGMVGYPILYEEIDEENAKGEGQSKAKSYQASACLRESQEATNIKKTSNV
jgi:hypothetical protein